jgi:hypothetical protein
MSLIRKFILTCEMCGKEKELNEVYGRYYVMMACTPNNPPRSSVIMDGLMREEILVCAECGEKAQKFIKLSEDHSVGQH